MLFNAMQMLNCTMPSDRIHLPRPLAPYQLPAFCNAYRASKAGKLCLGPQDEDWPTNWPHNYSAVPTSLRSRGDAWLAASKRHLAGISLSRNELRLIQDHQDCSSTPPSNETGCFKVINL